MSHNEEEGWQNNPIESAVPDFIPTSWANGRGGNPVPKASGRDAHRNGSQSSHINMSDWLIGGEKVEDSTSTNTDPVTILIKTGMILSVLAVTAGVACAALWFAITMFRGMLHAIG